MATFQSNVPADTTMLDFRSVIDDLGAPAKNCRFAIRILPVGVDNFIRKLGYTAMLRDMMYLSESAEFPGRGFDYLEGRYYGPSFSVPNNTKYTGEFSVSLITRQESYERQLFDDWLEVINPTNIFDFNYPEKYQCAIQVFQLAEFASPQEFFGSNGAARKAHASYLWQLHDAWPMQVNPQQVTWADNDVLRLNVTFAFRYWSRPGRDSMPGGSQGSLSPV